MSYKNSLSLEMLPIESSIQKSSCSFENTICSDLSATNTSHCRSDTSKCQTTIDSGDSIAVILGFYNGQAFLSDQIESIFNQTHASLHLFIFDDRSEERLKIEQFRGQRHSTRQLDVYTRKKNIGFAKNFLCALSHIGRSFEYYSFSDQDDVWHRNKLQKALNALSQCPKDHPALYCSRTATTDASCTLHLGVSPMFSKPPCFGNALVQNIGGGNTMVFNRAARDLIVNSLSNAEIVSHDWWCYQIIAGAGATVIYDPEPCLKYRQHANNLVGENTSWRARLLRLRDLLQGKFRRWNDTNLSALEKNRACLTKENRCRLDNFVAARNAGLIKRLILAKRSGIHRQTLLGNIGLIIGLVLNRF